MQPGHDVDDGDLVRVDEHSKFGGLVVGRCVFQR